MSFPFPRSEVESVAGWVLDVAKKAGIEAADFLYSAGEENTLSLRDGNPEDNTSGISFGVSLRVVDDEGRQGLAVGSSLDRAVLRDLVDWSLHNCKNSEPQEGVRLYQGPWPGEDPSLGMTDPAIHDLRYEDRLERCKRMTEVAQETDPRLISVRLASWNDGWGESLLASTEGLCAWKSGTFAGCGVSVVLSDGTSTEMGGFGTDSRLLSDIDPESVAKEAVRRTALTLGGRPLPTGPTDLVFDPEVTASLIEEVGDLFCASNIHKNRSLMKGKIGLSVASPFLTLIDDGRLPGRLGTTPFDGEGHPTQRTVLIDKGVARGYLYNLQYAWKDSVASTGNASRGLGTLPDVSPTNLMILPGENSFESLLARVGKGFYVTGLMGFHTMDPISGEYSLGAKGAMIESGKLSDPVGGVTIAGNLLDLFLRIDAVGNDLRFFGDVGACSLVVKEVVVAGS